MYQKCPKCGHERGRGEQGPEDVCGACGLIFSKYLRARLSAAMPAASAEVPTEGQASPEPGLLERARERLAYVPDEVPASRVYARTALLAVLAYFGVRFIGMDVPSWEISRTFMHNCLLPFHEFGHLLFMPLGEFMTLLGGSLFQVALPLLLLAFFLVRNRDTFAASAMSWWSAVSVLDVAPYIYDAKAPQHVLLTGRTGDTGAHDFIDVLGILGVLDRAQPIGYAVHRIGAVMLVASLAWAAWIVWRQWRVRR